MTHFQATQYQMTGYQCDPEVSAAIDKCEKAFYDSGSLTHVVRTAAGIALFSDFQLRVAAADIQEVIYTAGSGFSFQAEVA